MVGEVKHDQFMERAPPKQDHKQLTVVGALMLGLETAFVLLLLLPCALMSIIYKLLPSKQRSLTNQVVLVTGAGRGLGKGLALGLAKEGCKVAVADINKVNAEQTAAEILEAGGLAKAYCANVAKVKDVKRLQKDISVELGPVDILVNNAGLLHTEALQDFTDDEITNILEVNLASHFWTVREFLPAMRERNSGHIVAISSVAGFAGLANCTAYVATKFGVRGFMESVATELKSNPKNEIKTTTVFPYFINTSTDYLSIWDLRLPAMPVEKVVKDIISGVKKNKPLLFVPGFLENLLSLLQVMPSNLKELALKVYHIRVDSTKAIQSHHARPTLK